MPLHQPARVLSIAGTDPTGGAGMHADLKSIAAMGGYGMGVVTSIVVQNTVGVRSVYPVDVAVVEEQLRAVSDDVEIDAVKIGMLGRSDLIACVMAWLDEVRVPVVVVDPVMVATTGGRLHDRQATGALKELLTRASIVTPNVDELGVLTGQGRAEKLSDVISQARLLSADLDTVVYATCGDLADGSAKDVFASPDGTVEQFEFERIDTANTHGTGCSVSSALATVVVGAESFEQAYWRVRRWLDGALRAGVGLNVGSGRGPLHHSWHVGAISE